MANSRPLEPDELTWGIVGAWAASVSAALLVGWLGGMLLSGMLTVIVGRAVFGSPITIGETWAKIRGRLPSLFGLALLEAAMCRCSARAGGGDGGHARRSRRRRGGAPPRLPADAPCSRRDGVSVHGGVVRTRADRAGEAAGRRRDHQILCAGAQRLLAGAGHPGADIHRGDRRRGRDRGTVQHRRPGNAGRGPVHRGHA